MFDMNATTIFWGIFFSIIGLGYFSYGRKQNINFMLSGIALMVFPYFVQQTIILLSCGFGLIALPFLIDQLKKR